MDGAGPSLRFLVILASNYILFIFAFVCWIQKFKDFVRLFVHIENSSVEVRAEGTRKEKTELNLNSIIQAIKGEWLYRENRSFASFLILNQGIMNWN